MDLEKEWSQKHITDPKENPVDHLQSSILTPSWELDPTPLMANHQPRITYSNTRITLQEGSLREPCPTNENGIGWVQIQQKSLRWEEHIQGSSIITHEGLTTLTHPNRGWTIARGTWDALRETWGLTSEMVQKIYDSCATQRQLEKTFDSCATLSQLERTSSGSCVHILLLGLEEQRHLVEQGNGGDNRYERLDGRTKQGSLGGDRIYVGHMEDNRQVVHLSAGIGLPPTSPHPSRNPRRVLGIQVQRMVTYRRHWVKKPTKPSSTGRCRCD